ncbi:MAG: 30S ribosomal protein S3 [Microgenomates group bacterium GW2011_GWC2_45_8]|nr:MAG: 30S ribosomal protein S3 [Microgenomates group bacterium GW2011_GWC2_45_8]
MGQKVNPTSFRLGILYKPSSRWFAGKKEYQSFVLADIKLKKFIYQRLHLAGIVEVIVERSINTIHVTIHAARPGVVIGRGGSNLELLKNELIAYLKTIGANSALKFQLDVQEVKNPDLSAKVVGERIAEQLIKRYPHRRAISQAHERVMAAGAKGIKIQLSGRIGGAEIGRSEKYPIGTIPTQTLRSDIDYAQVPALTRSGYVGIKVWIYKGEVVI